MSREPHPSAAPRSRPPTGDLAALAASLRQNVEHAVRSEPADAGSVEGRFLRRLVGALSAYETAHRIMAVPERSAPVEEPPTAALGPQACPACGWSEFDAVGGGWVVHVLCRRCGTCSRAGRRGLVPTDPVACPGCDLADRCPNGNPDR